MYKKAITYGTLTGVLILFYFFTVYAMIGDLSGMTLAELQSLEMLAFVRYVIMVLGIYFTLNNVQLKEKYYSFARLFKAGLLTSLIIALFVGFMEFLYLALNPDYYEIYTRLYLESMEAGGATEEEINLVAMELFRSEWLHSPWMTGLYYFFETLFISTVAVIATAALVKTRKKKGNS